MKHVTTHKDSVYKGEMYRIVFECVYVKVAIGLLLFAFMLQPIAPAYANEAANDTAPEEEVEEVAPEPEPEPEPEEEVVEEVEEEIEETATDSEDAVTEDEEVVESQEEEVVALEDDSSQESDESTEEEGSSEDEEITENTNENEDVADLKNNTATDSGGIATSTVATEDDTASSSSSSENSGGGGSTTEKEDADPPTEIEDDPPERDVGDTASSTIATSTNETGTSTKDVSKDVLDEAETVDETTDEDAVVVDDVDDTDAAQEEDTTATSSDEAVEVVEVVRYVNEFNSDLNKYQFADSECVNVGDGSFYCSKNDSSTAATPDDAVFAQRDGGGDREIFVVIDGKTEQITDNKLEDLAPYYDELSHSIVWHRLEGGRYEIVAYDLKSEKETVLTDNNVNDMEPSRAGDYVVWQRWVEDNWEIMLFDGEEETQITHSNTHDVGAHIKGGYVIWNTNDTSGERLVMVYEIETGLTSEIKDTDGGMVENPRFVLVYDTTHDNGDVITKGYDFESGEVVPLAAVPKPTPAEIPEPDSTGETRALIQTKSTNNEEEIVDLDTDTATGTVKTTDKNATTTPSLDLENDEFASTTPTVEVEQATTTVDMTVDESEVLPLTEFDLIVEPYFEASSTQDSISPSATSSVE